MQITVSYIQERFDTFNKQIFEGKLPPIPIRLSRAKSYVGMCCFSNHKTLFGKVERSGFTLRISTYYDLPEADMEDVIIHEMIHYYIAYFRLHDTSPHGRLFRQMMADINTRYGRHIAISHRHAPSQQPSSQAEARGRWHVIAVVSFHDGRKGIKVLPRVMPSIRKYYQAVTASQEVAGVTLWMSNDVFFENYPNSAAFKVHLLDERIISQHLQNAEAIPFNR